MQIAVDGREVSPSKTMGYKGMMLGDVPNLAMAFGYTNASWTLKADLTCEFVCRLLNHMDEQGYDQCTPLRSDPSITEEPFIDFSSSYVLRAIEHFPKQGSKKPWRLYQNYALDILTLRYGAIEDGTMRFSSTPRPSRPPSRSPCRGSGRGRDLSILLPRRLRRAARAAARLPRQLAALAPGARRARRPP